MFACAHPAIEVGIRAPLMLQVVLGLDAATIASAFLVSPAAMGQRLARAKRGSAGRHPVSIPERDELPHDRRRAGRDLRRVRGRLDRPARHRCRRRDLAEEALFLARLVASCCRRSPRRSGFSR